MATKVETLYTSTLLQSLHLLKLSESLVLSDASMSLTMASKLQKEIAKEMSSLQKQSKKIQGQMEKLTATICYDKDPVSARSLSKPAKRAKIEREDTSLKNMRTYSLSNFHKIVDNLKYKTQNMTRSCSIVGKKKSKEKLPVTKKISKVKVGSSDHLSAASHSFNEGVLFFLNELFVCYSSQKSMISEEQGARFELAIRQIAAGKAELKESINALMVTTKPSKFVQALESELEKVRIYKLEEMASKVSEREVRHYEEEKKAGQYLGFKKHSRSAHLERETGTEFDGIPIFKGEQRVDVQEYQYQVINLSHLKGAPKEALVASKGKTKKGIKEKGIKGKRTSKHGAEILQESNSLGDIRHEDLNGLLTEQRKKKKKK